MQRLTVAGLILVCLGFGVFWILTAPKTIDIAEIPNHEPDLANGEALFWAGGCSSCHSRAKASTENLLMLGGGEGIVTPFGTFYAPNISPDRDDGIGAWILSDFINAMKLGVRPDGAHLYPAFPYTSYQRMRIEDLIDLRAFLNGLSAVSGQAPAHVLSFPFNIRRGLGLWKLLYADGQTFKPDPLLSAALNRGAYLVNGPGHCGECHTARNLIGGPDIARFLAGGPSPEGNGNIPNITSHKEAIGSWSEEDIVFMFTNGLTPSFDVIGGPMREVSANISRIGPADMTAIAQYLKSVTAVAPKPK